MRIYGDCKSVHNNEKMRKHRTGTEKLGLLCIRKRGILNI